MFTAVRKHVFVTLRYLYRYTIAPKRMQNTNTRINYDDYIIPSLSQSPFNRSISSPVCYNFSHPFLQIRHLRSRSRFPRLQLPRRLLRRTPIPSTSSTLLPQFPRFPLRLLGSSRRIILFVITKRHPFRLSRSIRGFVRRGRRFL